MSFRDPSPVNTPDTSSDHLSYAISSKMMLTAIFLILFFVILMVSLHRYSRWYFLSSRRFHLHRRFNLSRRASAANMLFADPSSTSVVITRGLNPSVIQSLPVFTFSTATAPNAIECAVCLSEFEENESGRVLPNCKHTFHVDCIDMWFHSHSSCPLCRAPVEPIAEEVKSAAEEVAISISDPISGDEHGSRPELCDTDRLGGTGTSNNSAIEDPRRKPAAIEVPRRNLGELEHELSENHSFRSPMSRVISFTRMLSRERRSPSSSSIGFPSVVSPPACSLQVRESDIEGDETRRLSTQ